jgi:hypothetical protein
MWGPPVSGYYATRNALIGRAKRCPLSPCVRLKDGPDNTPFRARPIRSHTGSPVRARCAATLSLPPSAVQSSPALHSVLLHAASSPKPHLPRPPPPRPCCAPPSTPMSSPRTSSQRRKRTRTPHRRCPPPRRPSSPCSTRGSTSSAPTAASTSARACSPSCASYRGATRSLLAKPHHRAALTGPLVHLKEH